jgi:predicted nuclease of predicted toxin-antitoxin system
MRWFADECIHSHVVRALRAAGHDVVYAAETFKTVKDADLAGEALREGRILLTEDKDFGELAFQDARAMPSTILMRFRGGRPQPKIAALLNAVERHGFALQGNFTVVEEGQVRLRPLALRG